MFLFLTRTRDKDYRLYKDSGELAGSSAEKIFMDNLRTSGINGTEEPFAVLNDSGYIVAGGMKTGSKDREGRPVRFTFCCELEEQEEARKVFLTLATEWEKSVEFMRSCLKEKDGEVRFSHVEFMNWLKSSGPERVKINLHNERSTSALKIFCCFVLGVLVIAGGLIYYAVNLKNELVNLQNNFILPPAKINELNEIHSDLSYTLEVIENSHRFMSMISEDAGLAVEYSHSEAEKAKILLDEVSKKIAGFKVEE